MKVLTIAIVLSVLTTAVLAQSRCCRGKNEIFTECGPNCGGDGCSARVKRNLPCVQKCKSGCFCECGFFRNEHGNCVRPNECPGGNVTNTKYPTLCPGTQCCGDFENWGISNECLDSCPPHWRPHDGCPKNAKEGCWCLPGFKRDGRGVCVRARDCNQHPVTTKPTPEPTKPTPEPTKPTQKPTKRTDPPTKPTSKPTHPTSNPHDEACKRKDLFSESGCGFCDTCSQQIGFDTKKPQSCPLEPCHADTCRCLNGFFKDDIRKTGKCIPWHKCWSLIGKPRPTHAPGQCPENSEPGCGTACNHCETIIKGTENRCNRTCIRHCNCKHGLFWSEKTKKCISRRECELEVRPNDDITTTSQPTRVTPKVCSTNETREGCARPCETCLHGIKWIEEDEYPCAELLLDDSSSEEGEEGCQKTGECYCREGFWRHKGQCVSLEDCFRLSKPEEPTTVKPTTSKPTEKPTQKPTPKPTQPSTTTKKPITLPSCDPDTEDYGCRDDCKLCFHAVSKHVSGREQCISQPGPCVPECQCKPGLFRNSQKQCVTVEKCCNEAGVPYYEYLSDDDAEF